MTIRVKYNINTGEILGYYPSNINYPSITIDTKKNIISDSTGDFPYITISKENHEINMGKDMVVIDGIYKERQITQEELLFNAKNEKLSDLDTFHNSEKVRVVNVEYEGKLHPIFNDIKFRNILQEQIVGLDLAIKNNIISENEAFFVYRYNHNGKIPISLSDLKMLFLELKRIVDNNYQIYRDHRNSILEIKTISKIDKYDYKQNYITDKKIILKS